MVVAEGQVTFKELFDKVQKHMGWSCEKTMFWFKTPNPNLGGVSPRAMIYRGRMEKLEKWIESAIDENTPSQEKHDL